MNMQVAIQRQEPGQSRKRLGQFFSGGQVGRLLAAFCNAPKATSIIDPMVGRGDLLQACLDLGSKPEKMLGIEIDRRAAVQAAKVSHATIVTASAFDPSSHSTKNGTGFDLVIANPPYVRYQDLAAADGHLPSGEEVREGLLASLQLIGDLDKDERNALMRATLTYSGHADLAVPSVILCMALVGRGGTLGLVLPQAWLSRNYSMPVRACLEQLFHVEYIVDDASANWFPEALVRTTLLIAKRRNGGGVREVGCTHLRIHAAAADQQSLVGALSTDSSSPERDFVASIRAGAAYPSSLVEVRDCAHDDAASADPGVRALADAFVTLPEVDFIEALQVTANQGLRTGANDFFYVKPIASNRFQASNQLGGVVVDCPEHALRPAIRDQSGHKQAVLDLRRIVLPEDRDESDARSVMGRALADHVRSAANVPSGKPGREKPIAELSAVRTNVRKARGDQPSRHWYMLPDFQRRHTPDCYLPRLNSKRPIAMASDGETIVDANFITFACEGELDGHGFGLLLNSAWAWAWLEHEGAVMGGGALKIEATMLRRMPMPCLTKSQIAHLNMLGRQGLTPAVDPLIALGIVTSEQNNAILDAAARRLAARSK